MEKKEKLTLHSGTIIFLIIALLQIRGFFSSVSSLARGNITSVLGIASFVLLVLFALSFSKDNPKLTKTYALVLLILGVLSIVLTLFQSELVTPVLYVISSIWRPLCYLAIYLFYKKTNGEDKNTIKSLFILSLFSLVTVLVNLFGNMSAGIIYSIIFLLIPTLLIGAFSLKNARGPLTDPEVKKKMISVLIGIIVISVVVALIYVIIVFVVGAVEEANDPKNWGASFDWGKGNYWDSSEGTVKRNIWYDFFH